MPPWFKLSRRLACETLLHWRAFVREEEESKHDDKAPAETLRRAYQIPRDTLALTATHIKAVALARRKPTPLQLAEDLGWSADLKFSVRDWSKTHLLRALEDYARRFVGTDFAPKFARNVASTLKG